MPENNKKMCQLFISKSEGILDEKIKNIKKRLKGKINLDTDFMVFDNPDELDEKEFINFLTIPPFFSDHKVIVIKNIENFPKKIIEILTDRIKNLEKDSSIFYLITATSKKINKKFLDSVKAKGKVKQIFKPKTGSIKKWLKEKQELDGIHITEKAAETLIENVDRDLTVLKREYEKLLLYAQSQDGKKIDIDSVNHLVSRVYNLKIFDLIDSIGEKNKEEALKALKSLLLESDNLIGVVTLTYRMFKTILYIIYGQSQKAHELVSSNINAPDFMVKKIFSKYERFSKNYSEREAIRAMGLLNDADISLRDNVTPSKNIISKLISEICK